MPVTTEPKTKTTTPPLDTNGEMQKAATMLRQMRKRVDSMPYEWAKWIVDSLAAGYADSDADSE